MSIIIGLLIGIAAFVLVSKSNKQKQAAEQARIKKLINVQNIVSNRKSDKLILSEKQLRNAIQSYVAAQNKGITEAITRLNATDNPKAFFTQVDRIRASIKNLQYLDDAMPGTIDPPATEIRKTFEGSLTSDIDDMIDRAWINAQMDAAGSARIETKRNKYMAFFDTLDVFSDKMKPENIAHIVDLKTSIGL